MAGVGNIGLCVPPTPSMMSIGCRDLRDCLLDTIVICENNPVSAMVMPIYGTLSALEPIQATTTHRAYLRTGHWLVANSSVLTFYTGLPL